MTDHIPSPPGRLPRTKIVATIGPASRAPERIEALIAAGVSVFRLNFSHGNRAEHGRVLADIRRLAGEAGRPVAVLQDLQGPKLRVGDLVDDGPIPLEPGATIHICTLPVGGTAERISTTYDQLARDLEPGDPVLLADGAIELRVTGIELDTPFGDEVVCEVIVGGLLLPQKGINLPGTRVSAPALTEKDLADLAFGVGIGVDVVALSFVRSADDILLAKAEIARLGGGQPVIAKIEKPQAVAHLDAIVAASDGVMVARGDLGVELSPERVPIVQKRLIRAANQAGIPVVTATQMLESMMTNPRPTRAEASDVANAILDGSDAVMLSGETAVGDYPIETVRMMARIARAIEDEPVLRASAATALRQLLEPQRASDDPRAVARAARALAEDIQARAIAVLTATGRTARRVSQERPGVPVVAFTDRPAVAQMLTLWHSIYPILVTIPPTTDEAIARIDEGVRRLGLATSGDRVVIVGVTPRASDERSIFLEVHRVR